MFHVLTGSPFWSWRAATDLIGQSRRLQQDKSEDNKEQGVQVCLEDDATLGEL
jgi:hypothetical protein